MEENIVCQEEYDLLEKDLNYILIECQQMPVLFLKKLLDKEEIDQLVTLKSQNKTDEFF